MQHRALVLCALTACTTHNRISGGATFGTDNSTAGGEVTGEAAVGAEGTNIVVGGTARAGHGVTGAALRIGAELERAPHPLGARATVTIGPAFFDRDGDIEARFEARGSIAIVQGLNRSEPSDDHGSSDQATTVGVELFVSSIGFADHQVLLGIGLTIGKHKIDHPRSIAASRRAKRAKLLAAD